jgi:hypothetical protein
MGLFKPSIEKMKAKKDIKGLIGLLSAKEDKDVETVGRAANALGEIGDATAVEPLVQTLRDRRPGVRIIAVNALCKLGWEPRNNIEKAYYLMAKRGWEGLSGERPLTVGHLAEALQDEDPLV